MFNLYNWVKENYPEFKEHDYIALSLADGSRMRVRRFLGAQYESQVVPAPTVVNIDCDGSDGMNAGDSEPPRAVTEITSNERAIAVESMTGSVFIFPVHEIISIELGKPSED